MESNILYFIRHGNSCSNDADYIYKSNNSKTNNSLDKIKKLTKKNSNFIKLLNNKLNHPSLSNLGIAQTILLGNAFNINEYKNILNNYTTSININDETIVYCSPTLRTIMTAMLSLRSINYYNQKNNKSPIKIIICPYLIERPNKIPNKISKISKTINNTLQISKSNIYIPNDLQNNIVHPTKLRKLTEYISNWLKNNYKKYFIDYEIFMKLEEVNKILLSNNLVDGENDDNGDNGDNGDNNKNDNIITLNKIINEYYMCLNKPNKNELLKKIIINVNDILIDNELLINQTSKDNLKLINNDLEKFLYPELLYNYNIVYMDDKTSDFKNMNYKEFEKINEEKNFNSFYSYIESKKIINRTIICFTHGAKMKKHFNQEQRFLNTQILKSSYKNSKHILEKINTNQSDSNTILLPSNMPSNHNKFFNNCSKLCGLLGSSSKKMMFKVQQIINDTPYSDKNHIEQRYLTKYLKYKMKYLKLKEQKNE